MMNRLLAVLRIGRVKLVDDGGPIRRLQTYEGDLGAYGGPRVIDHVPHVEQFGHAGVPPIDSDVVLAAPAGDRTQTVVIGCNHQPSRPKGMQPGDSTQYDVRGQLVQMTAAGIVIDGNGLDLPVTVRNVTKLRVEASQIECTGDIVAFVDGTAISLKALHDAYNAHGHGNVASGSAKTGPTDHPA